MLNLNIVKYVTIKCKYELLLILFYNSGDAVKAAWLTAINITKNNINNLFYKNTIFLLL